MRFEQYVTSSNKLLVYMNPQDLVLPVPENVAKNDVERYRQEIYTPLQLFNVETYETLKKCDIENWEVVYGSVNKFLSIIPSEVNKKICMTFMMMHKILNELVSENLLSSIQQLGVQLNQLDTETDLCSKLSTFVEADMPIPNLDNVGGRPQDTEAMTFKRAHVVPLTAIALLCKMLSPIFGHFFWQYKKNTTVDNSIKEIHCATILTPLFNKRYKQLILKLDNFIRNIIAQQYKPKDDITSAINGNTISSQAINAESNVYTRKFITVNLSKTDGNIMTYVTTCVKNSVDTQYRTASSKSNIKERDANTLKESTSDEGNASRLENESFTSAKTADVPIIVEWNIELIINKWIEKTQLSQDIYTQAIAYYKTNLPPMTPISNYLLCTYFGHAIDGAAGIALLPARTYSKLSIVLQYILLKQGFIDLAHAIMLIPLNRMKAQLSNIDNKVRMTWTNTYAYRNFKSKFPYGVGNRECNNKLKEIVEYITTRVHTYNTAPVFWDLIGQDNFNNQEYQCNVNFMEDMCNFINIVINKEDY